MKDKSKKEMIGAVTRLLNNASYKKVVLIHTFIESYLGEGEESDKNATGEAKRTAKGD